MDIAHFQSFLRKYVNYQQQIRLILKNKFAKIMYADFCV